MQLIDLEAQQKRIRDQISSNIQKVLAHGQYIMGPEIFLLEKELAAYVGVKHAIACSSGTDALLLALMAHGVGPGDIVLTTPFTFIATAEVICLLGATPVYVDIDPQTFNIDPARLEAAIVALQSGKPASGCSADGTAASGKKPKGIIAVDLFGLPADYDRICALAEKHGLFVIEDAAQSFGAVYRGRKACALAEIGCASFFPAKPLGCYGDGGMCFTDNDALSETLGSLRLHGKGGHKYDNIRIGVNGRMDTLQAAILLAKFDIFEEEVGLRQKVAERYSFMLRACDGIEIPTVPEGTKSIWAQYSVLARNEDHRSRLQAKLKEGGVPTAIYYPKPLHLQTAFAFMGYRKGAFPVSEDYSQRVFSLPMHPYLTAAEQMKVASLLKLA
jgi:UDP-2-acetamido-2-deoxy-ribo-hexuluronate aminotransferase